MTCIALLHVMAFCVFRESDMYFTFAKACVKMSTMDGIHFSHSWAGTVLSFS